MIALLLLLFQSPFQQALDAAPPYAVIDASQYAPPIKRDVIVSKPVRILHGMLDGVKADVDVSYTLDTCYVWRHATTSGVGQIAFERSYLYGTLTALHVKMDGSIAIGQPGQPALVGRAHIVTRSYLRGGMSADCAIPGAPAVICGVLDTYGPPEKMRVVGGAYSAARGCVRADPVDGIWRQWP